MTPDEIRKILFDVLGDIAPEADFAQLGVDEELREALDLDSVDFLHFVQGIHDVMHLDIPESDYGQLSTLARCIEYIRSRAAP